MSSVNLNRQKKLNAQMSEVMDDFDRFEFFFASNWKRIVAAALIIVLVIAVIVCISSCRSKSQLAAAQAFDKAENIEQLQAAIKKHGKPSANVYLRLAGMYIEKKDYKNARIELKNAIACNDAAEMKYRAMLNLGYLDELEGKFADGAASFADFAKNRREVGTAAYAAEAYVAAGRLYALAGKAQESKKILEAGRNFIQSVPADERVALQTFSGMINSLLANPAKPAKK